MTINKWQPVETAPMNKLVLVRVCSSRHKDGLPWGAMGMFEPTREVYVNGEYIDVDFAQVQWMELPLDVDGTEMQWFRD